MNRIGPLVGALALLMLESGLVNARDFDVTGRVFDADTKQPIRRPLVVAQIRRWSNLVHGNIEHSVACFAVQADDEGRFSIPASNWVNSDNNDSQGIYLVPYHPDFMLSIHGAAQSHNFHRTPIIGGLLPNRDRVELPVRSFQERDNQRRWFYKVIMPIDLLDCPEAPVVGKELLWDALRQEAQEFTAAQGGRPVQGQPQTVMDRLKRVTGTITERDPRVVTSSLESAPAEFQYRCSVPGTAHPQTAIPIPQRIGRIEQRRVGNDLLVEVPVTMACLSGGQIASVAKEPLAEQHGQRLRVSWAWDIQPPDESLHGCECSRKLRFRLSDLPYDNLEIAASTRSSIAKSQ